MNIIFVSDDKKRFIVMKDHSPSFINGDHLKIAKKEGLQLDKMDNLTFKFQKFGKGKSVKEFLNSELTK